MWESVLSRWNNITNLMLCLAHFTIMQQLHIYVKIMSQVIRDLLFQ